MKSQASSGNNPQKRNKPRPIRIDDTFLDTIKYKTKRPKPPKK